jgi:hypothetical protein
MHTISSGEFAAFISTIWKCVMCDGREKCIENKTYHSFFSGTFITNISIPYFGVLHPVARTLSRLLEEPSLATTLQDIYFIYFCRYMFRPLLAIFKRNTQLF